MKKVGLGVLIGLYFIVSILVTTCLLAFNDYGISVFDDTSLIIVNDNNKIGDYVKGSLLIVKNDLDNLKNNSEIVYYDTYDNNKIRTAKVVEKEKITNTEYTLTLDNGNYLSGEFLIGDFRNIKSYAVLGSILAFFESRFGYLFFIILPILVFFIVEVRALIIEIKPKKKAGKKNESTRKDKK